MEKKINLTVYDEKNIFSVDSRDHDEILGKIDKNKNNWVHFYSLETAETLLKVFDIFEIERSILRDIESPEMFESSEDYDEYVFFKFRVRIDGETGENFKNEKIILILGEKFLITISLNGYDVFTNVRDMMLSGRTKIRRKGTGYLFFRLLRQSIVDNYVMVFQKYIDDHEDIENILIAHTSEEMLARILALRKKILPYRDYLMELENITDILQVDESELINKKDLRTLKNSFIRRSKDLMEMFFELRNWNSVLLDIYRSNMSEKMERVMRMLTILSTIFLPLTFLTGFFGMNFKYIPLLGEEMGYAIIIAIMAFLALLMIVIFRKKRWL